MELKTLSNKHLQYKAAGLEEAYHLVYYIPQGDTTTWTARVARFKNRADEEDFQLIKSMTIEAFVKALDYLELNTQEAISFGDRGIDIQASLSAGVDSVACLWGTKEKDILLSLKPTFVVNRPIEIIHLLE